MKTCIGYLYFIFQILKCFGYNDLDWWKTSIIYQVYPRSLKDNTSDGIGDLQGIERKVEYFKELGVGAIWLSPIFKSPMADFGYDITDFKEIDKIFGNMNDFVSLQRKLKSLGIKLLLDFVPNHSSTECEWFKKSLKNVEPYKDFYVWKDPKGWENGKPIPPNNWISNFEGSAWEFVPSKQQFYLHSFGVEQADLNYRNKQLVEEMKNILTFWLDKGVDGFRTDAVPFIFEDINFPDEPVISNNSVIPGFLAWSSLNHIYTQNQPETYELITEFRALLDSYKKKDGETRLLLIEAYAPLNSTLKYYGNATAPGSHMPFNFALFDLNRTSTAKDFNTVIHTWLDNMVDGRWANWVIGNHDNPRAAARYGDEMVDAMNMIVQLLPGTAITFYGEEIGMRDGFITWNQTVDPMGKNVGPQKYQLYSRDPERTPFQWDSSDYAGFSDVNGSTWLPVNPDYWQLNVEAQKMTLSSHINVYKRLAQLRRDPIFTQGDFSSHVISDWIFAFTRSLQGRSTYLVIINLGSNVERVTLKKYFTSFPDYVYVHTRSINSEHNIGDAIDTSRVLKLRPKSSLVIATEIVEIRMAAFTANISTGVAISTSILTLFFVSLFAKYL